MKYLFSDWERLKAVLIDKSLLLLLDYDGTLTPIRESAFLANLSKENKDLLSRFSKNPGCSLAIISGRSLEDIKGMVGLKGIIYAGNHGLQIEGPKIKFESQVSPRLKLAMRNIAQDLRKRLSDIKGALIEDKGLTLSVHYRLVRKKDMPLLDKITSEVINPYRVRNKIKINSGKKVYEIKPPFKWDKGKVVLYLLARQQFASKDKKVLPIYIGDDVTDEDAFRAIKNKGLTVFVGKPKKSYAQYYLRNHNGVQSFLEKIYQIITVGCL